MKIGVILMTVLATVGVLIGACASEPVHAKGTLQLLVTDAPPKVEVTSIVVTLESVAVHKAVAEQEQSNDSIITTESTGNTTITGDIVESQDEESGWELLDMLEGKETFDLLQVKGIEEILAVSELEAGRYTQIRMTISRVQVKLGDGELQDATLPSGKLKFTRSFEIVAGETTALLFDFDAEKSVKITGSDKIMVQPVIRLSMTNPKASEADKSNLKIVTPSLPDGTINVPYNAIITAKGGTGLFTWSIESGMLPAGLSLDSANGNIFGTPTVSGESTFTVRVSDNSIPMKEATRQYSITIAGSVT